MAAQARLTEILVSKGHHPDSLGWIQNMTLVERQGWIDALGAIDDNQHDISLGSAPQQGMSNVDHQQQQQANPPEGVSQDHFNLALALGFSAENYNPQPLNQPTVQAAQAVDTDVMDIDTAQGSAQQQDMSNVEQQQQQQQQANPPEGVSQDHFNLALELGFSAENYNPQPLSQPTPQAAAVISQNNAEAAQASGSDVMDIDSAQGTAAEDNRGRKRSRSSTTEAAGSDSQKKQKKHRPFIVPCTYDADGRATFPGPKTYVDKVKELRHGRFTLMEGQLPPTTGLQTQKFRRRPRSRGPRRIAF